MITNTGNPTADRCPCELFGLSTDTKPTNVKNASIFYEMDTKSLFLYDEENGAWLRQSGEDKQITVTFEIYGEPDTQTMPEGTTAEQFFGAETYTEDYGNPGYVYNDMLFEIEAGYVFKDGDYFSGSSI